MNHLLPKSFTKHAILHRESSEVGKSFVDGPRFLSHVTELGYSTKLRPKYFRHTNYSSRHSRSTSSALLRDGKLAREPIGRQ
jgi:hypothetical protein